MSSSPERPLGERPLGERPLGDQDPYAPKRLRGQEQTKPQAVGKLSRGEGDDVPGDEPVGLRRTPPPLIGRPPQPPPEALRSSTTARDIGLSAIVGIASALAVVAIYRFASTPPAPAPQLASASATRLVRAPAYEPTGPAAAQPAATARAAAPPSPAAAPAPPPPATLPVADAIPPTQKVSALPPADTRSLAAEPQASELRRALSPEQRQAMAALVARGKELLRNGDFSSARLILEHAADAGEPDAALTLGSTYDPAVLARLGIREQVANVESARAWYAKAQEFGSTEASSRLKTLPDR